MSNLLKLVIGRSSSLATNCFQPIGNKLLIHTSAASLIKTTPVLEAEPMKAKKRVDPQVLMARENRKRKKIEREVRRMERFGRKLKPVEESEPDRLVLKEIDQRKRSVKPLNKEELDDEYFLRKDWANFINKQHQNQMEQIQRALEFQQKALKELRKDNVMLYNAAIQLDEHLVPFVREGPVHTPPNKAYEPPEGDYLDVTYLYDRR